MQRDERLGRTTVDIPQLLIMLAKNRRGLGASRPGRGGGGGVLFGHECEKLGQ